MSESVARKILAWCPLYVYIKISYYIVATLWQQYSQFVGKTSLLLQSPYKLPVISYFFHKGKNNVADAFCLHAFLGPKHAKKDGKRNNNLSEET